MSVRCYYRAPWVPGWAAEPFRVNSQQHLARAYFVRSESKSVVCTGWEGRGEKTYRSSKDQGTRWAMAKWVSPRPTRSASSHASDLAYTSHREVAPGLRLKLEKCAQSKRIIACTPIGTNCTR